MNEQMEQFLPIQPEGHAVFVALWTGPDAGQDYVVTTDVSRARLVGWWITRAAGGRKVGVEPAVMHRDGDVVPMSSWVNGRRDDVPADRNPVAVHAEVHLGKECDCKLLAEWVGVAARELGKDAASAWLEEHPMIEWVKAAQRRAVQPSIRQVPYV